MSNRKKEWEIGSLLIAQPPTLFFLLAGIFTPHQKFNIYTNIDDTKQTTKYNKYNSGKGILASQGWQFLLSSFQRKRELREAHHYP